MTQFLPFFFNSLRLLSSTPSTSCTAPAGTPGPSRPRTHNLLLPFVVILVSKNISDKLGCNYGSEEPRRTEFDGALDGSLLSQ